MPKLYITVVVLFLVQAAFSQQPELQWVKTFTVPGWGDSYTNGRAVGVDQAGNVYSVGNLHRTVDFDPGPGVYTMAGATWADYGVYISKLDANGNFVWARQVPTIIEFADIEVKVDKQGNVFLYTNLTEDADIDAGPGVYTMNPIGFRDALLVKFNTDGNIVWAKQFGGPGDTGPQTNALVLDNNGNIILCGMFNNTVDFDPGPGVYNLTAAAHFQSYIVKLNPAGDLIYAKQFGNGQITYNNTDIIDVKCDAQGNIYTVGGFAGTCDFDPGAGVYNLTSKSIRDGFIAKLTPNADFVWARQITNTSTEFNNHCDARAVEIDDQGNVYSTGSFIGTYDFDPGAVVNNLTGKFSNDCYILKLSAQGDFVWVKTIGGAYEFDQGNDMEIDKDNNLYIVGDFGTVIDFDPGPGDYTLTSPHYGASAVVKLNSNGEFMFAVAFPSISYGVTVFRRMYLGEDLKIYVTGYMYGTVDFDPGPGVFPATGSSGYSPFVLKLAPCANRTTSTLNISTCDEYTLNNHTFASSGTYTQTIPNKAGCDSVITLHLTINKKATQQSKLICEGETFFAGGADQTVSGTYVDVLRTALGCDSVVTTHLTVNPKPAPNLGPDQNLCSNTAVDITPGSFTTYLWQDGSTAANYHINAAGKYWVRVTNSFGCPATDTLTIPAVLPVPANFLKESDSVCDYGSITMAPANPYATYKWSTGATANKVQLQLPGIYWLRVTDANGCTGVDTFTLYPKQCLQGFYMPNAFSPNGDGKNELLRPLLFGKVKQYRFAVYNRWGAIVFQSTDPQKGWDGTIAGNAQPNGIFVWTCSYQLEGMERKVEKGTTTLIR